MRYYQGLSSRIIVLVMTTSIQVSFTIYYMETLGIGIFITSSTVQQRNYMDNWKRTVQGQQERNQISMIHFVQNLLFSSILVTTINNMISA
jgi:hypothetical protein